MSQPTSKTKIVRAVEELPETATIEDAIERLTFLHKIEVGLKQSREGKTVPLDEVEARLKRRRQSQQPTERKRSARG
ncbi:MAG: hypothetical protein BRD45_00665 [Bacteroidetes bacterium QS_8_64_10]|nr:MAG: hypothetical protein BRD45_00665 [Bacteroidetes bacterium QS_8_64_10]